jgi:hypothetical protein
LTASSSSIYMPCDGKGRRPARTVRMSREDIKIARAAKRAR